MRPVNDSMRADFLAELDELLEKLCAEIDRMRGEQESARLGREGLDRIFRCIHSVKGVSASAGLNLVSKLAHETESLLDGARSRRVNSNVAILDALEDAADAISECLSDAAADKPTRTSPALIER